MGDFTNLCQECPHYSYCELMCPFAQLYANQEKTYMVERYVKDPEQPDNCQYVLWPRNKRETHTSQLGSESEDGEVRSIEETKVFDSEAYRVFWDNVNYKTRRIEIISDVLFKRLSYADVAVKYGYKDSTNAYKSFLRYIQYLAQRASQLEQEEVRLKRLKSLKQYMTNKHGRMNKGLKQFLCFHCLGLTVDEIMDWFNDSKDTVYYALKKHRKKLQNGELRLVFDEDGFIVEASDKTSKPRKNRTAHEVQLQE